MGPTILAAAPPKIRTTNSDSDSYWVCAFRSRDAATLYGGLRRKDTAMAGLLGNHPFPSQPRGQLSLAEVLSNNPVPKPALKGLAECLVQQNEKGGLIIGDKVSWLGYGFLVHSRVAGWREVAGVYIFAGRSTDDQGRSAWHPFYVGQCQSFAGYIPTHCKWSEAERLGATHVHARVEQGVLARQNLEAELIQAYQPRLNVQLR